MGAGFSGPQGESGPQGAPGVSFDEAFVDLTRQVPSSYSCYTSPNTHSSVYCVSSSGRNVGIPNAIPTSNPTDLVCFHSEFLGMYMCDSKLQKIIEFTEYEPRKCIGYTEISGDTTQNNPNQVWWCDTCNCQDYSDRRERPV